MEICCEGKIGNDDFLVKIIIDAKNAHWITNNESFLKCEVENFFAFINDLVGKIPLEWPLIEKLHSVGPIATDHFKTRQINLIKSSILIASWFEPKRY